MSIQIGEGTAVDPTAELAGNVSIGRYCKIGKGVRIASFRGNQAGSVSIGDCTTINEGTRILAGEEGISIGDWNVFHNAMLVMGSQGLAIGHNCWFGQNTIIDSSGGLSIGNGVRVGMYSQIWTHVASGELIEGCTLYAMRPTIIEDEVWLVGSCIVGSGIRLGFRSICLASSNITKDTERQSVYAGIPAKRMENLCFWKPVSAEEKMKMMKQWVSEYSSLAEGRLTVEDQPGGDAFSLDDVAAEERLTFHIGSSGRIAVSERETVFNLVTKRYTKRLTSLERGFYRYIFGNKARFLPVQSDAGPRLGGHS